MVGPQAERITVTEATRIVARVRLDDARLKTLAQKDGRISICYEIPGMPWVFDNRTAVLEAVKVIVRHEGDENFDDAAARERVLRDLTGAPAYVRVVKQVPVGSGRVSFSYALYDVNPDAHAEEACAFSVVFVERDEDRIEFRPSGEHWMNLRSQPNGLRVIAVTGVDHPLGIKTPDREWLLTNEVSAHDIPLTDDQLKDALGDRIKERSNNGKAQKRPERDKPEDRDGSSGDGLSKPAPPVADDERTETSEPDPVGIIESDGSELVQSVGEVDSSIGACIGEAVANELAEACAEPVGASS